MWSFFGAWEPVWKCGLVPFAWFTVCYTFDVGNLFFSSPSQAPLQPLSSPCTNKLHQRICSLSKEAQLDCSLLCYVLLTLSRRLDHDWNTGLQRMKHDKMQRMKHETPRLTTNHHEWPRMTTNDNEFHDWHTEVCNWNKESLKHSYGFIISLNLFLITRNATIDVTHEMPRLTTKFFARISNRQLIKLAVRVRVNDANFTLRVWNARDRATSQTLFVMIWDFEFYNF